MRNLTRAVSQKASRGGYTVQYCVKGSLEPGSQCKHNSNATLCNIILCSSAHDLTYNPGSALMKYREILNPERRQVRLKSMTLNDLSMLPSQHCYICYSYLLWDFVLWNCVSLRFIPLKVKWCNSLPCKLIVPLFHCQPVNLTYLTVARCLERSTMYDTVVDLSKMFAKVSGMK